MGSPAPSFLVNANPARGAELAVVDPEDPGRHSRVSGRQCNCGGTGLALGPFQRLLVACGTPFIVNAVNGTIISNITQVNSGDVIWA